MPELINDIEYPDHLVDDAKELIGLTRGFLNGLVKAGVPEEMHTDLLGELYAEQPQRLKRVMAFQIARRERMAWEADRSWPDDDNDSKEN